MKNCGNSSGAPIIPDPPRGLALDQVKGFLADDDPETAAYAGYLASLFGEPSGLPPPIRLKEPKKTTPEEEEMAMMQSNFGYGEAEQTPGKPQFALVASITEKDRADALARAFSQAKQKATRLAAAAGAELGAVAEISKPSDQNIAELAYYTMQARGGTVAETSENEMAAAKPGLVTFDFMLEARFRLK